MNPYSRTPTPATPPATSAPAPASGRPDRLVIDATEMTQFLAQGKARYLSRIVRSFARHDGHWWLDNTGEWLRITDEDYAARLDKLAQQ